MSGRARHASKGRKGVGSGSAGKRDERATACKACRDRKQKCVRSAAINDICGQCTMRNEPCLWPPNSVPRFDAPPGQGGSRRDEEMQAVTAEITRLSKLVVLLEDQLADQRPRRRAAFPPPWYPPLDHEGRPHSHFHSHHHLHQAPPYELHPHDLYSHHEFGARSPPSPAQIFPSFQLPPKPEPNVIEGAAALVSLSNSPISAHSAHPQSANRHEGYPDYPTPHSAIQTTHPSASFDDCLPPPLMERPPPPPTSRGSPHGPIRLPSLRLSIPSTSPSPGPMSSARASALRSAHPFALSPMRRVHHFTPLGPPPPPLHSPFSYRSPALAGPDRRHAFLSPSVNSPASAIVLHRTPYPPLLYFASIPADGASAEEWALEQAQREVYEKEMSSPIKRKEAREAHERRYDAAVAEMMRGRKGKGKAEGGQPNARDGEAVEGGQDGEVRSWDREVSQRPVLGALRAGSGDTMLGGMAPSPIDRLISPVKERKESRLGEEIGTEERERSVGGAEDAIGGGQPAENGSVEGNLDGGDGLMDI